MGTGEPRTFRVALAQVNLSVGDIEGNKQRIIAYINRAREKEADLVAFPELSITGYPPEDLLLRSSFIQENQRALDEVVRETKGIVAVVGYVQAVPCADTPSIAARPRAAEARPRLYSAAAIAGNGKLVSVYRKILLPNYGVFDERRYFSPGDEALVFELGRGGTDRFAFAVNICEDIWSSEVSELQAEAGARVIINISASPYHVAKGIEREELLSARARETGATICYVNLLGGQDELVFDGESLVFSPGGDLLARAPQFEETLLVADIDATKLSGRRARRNGEGIGNAVSPLVPQRPARAGVVKIGDIRPAGLRIPVRPEKAERLPHAGEVYGALILGTRDYVRKNGFEKAVVGLSGGMDSSLVAAIAVDALGAANVRGVAMPSRYTSAHSTNDATELAGRLGIEILTVPMDELFEGYLKTLGTVFAGRPRDVAEENIQARIRGNILMALSNKFGWLVLTTGNKSETAVGYCTLYGDMAGGFAVIKDVPKTLVYELGRFRNSLPGGLVIPESVFAKAPTAELGPDQKDQDTLPPYEVLDPILEAYVEMDKSRDEIVAMGFDSDTVDRVLVMVDASEYKRRQAPPGVKITPKAFGRDRRIPITNLYRVRRNAS